MTAPSVTILVNGTIADADTLNTIHSALLTYLQNLNSNNFQNVQLLNNIRHGYLGGGVANYHDNDHIYQSMRNGGYSYHATVPASCTITIPAGQAVNGIYVFMEADLILAAKTNVHLPLNFKSGPAAAADLSVVGLPDPRFEIALTYTGTMTAHYPKLMNITSGTVPTIGGGFDPAKATVLKVGTAFGDGACAEYSMLAIPY